MDLYIRRSAKSRRAKIRVLTDRLEVVLPSRSPMKVVDDLVSMHADWLIRHYVNLAHRLNRADLGDIFYLGESYRFEQTQSIEVQFDPEAKIVKAASLAKVQDWLMEEARARLIESLKTWAPAVGKAPMRVSVRDQRSRWGSCSTRGNINLSWRLIMAPPKVLDYVVIHELCHLVHANHSVNFWSLVSSIDPNFKESERWLKDHNQTLMLAFAGSKED